MIFLTNVKQFLTAHVTEKSTKAHVISQLFVITLVQCINKTNNQLNHFLNIKLYQPRYIFDKHIKYIHDTSFKNHILIISNQLSSQIPIKDLAEMSHLILISIIEH